MGKLTNPRKVLPFYIMIGFLVLVIGLAAGRSSSDNWINGFWGSTHANCHGSTGATTGTLEITSMNGTTIPVSSFIEFRVRVTNMGTDIINDDVHIFFAKGYATYNPWGRGNNANFTWVNNTARGIVLTGYNSAYYWFRAQAPSWVGTFTVITDVLDAGPDGQNPLLWLTNSIVITTVVNNAPFVENVTKTPDPVELGTSSIIDVDVYDSNGISSVLINLETTNRSMSIVSGNIYRYSYSATSIGVKSFTIYGTDNTGKINSTSGSITVQDTTAPNFSNLVESANLLEFGYTEIIIIDVADFSGVSSVLLEYDTINHTMTNIGGNTWQFNAWTPTSIGVKNYKIWMNDTNNLWNSTTGSINVQDTTQPTFSNIVESADPLELGITETIAVDVTDNANVDTVYLEFDALNHTMTNIGGNSWRYNTWIPFSVGVKNYKIWANDSSNNWNSTTGSITVQDTGAPTLSNLVETTDPLELTSTVTITVDATDNSGIFEVLIEFDALNHSMTIIGGNTWRYNTWTPSSTGVKNYKIWAKDNQNNWNSLINSITVQDTTKPSLSGLIESADPIELSATETITITVTDANTISQVSIEFDGSNHSMSNIGGNNWQYAWAPSPTGSKSYTIWAVDAAINIQSTSGSISIQDTTKPTWSNLVENADPLPLGQSETIIIDAFDTVGSGISQVLLEYQGSNYTMSFIGGNSYRWNTWNPGSIGNFPYTVWIIDNSGNINSTMGDITVIASSGPIIGTPLKIPDPVEYGMQITVDANVTDVDGVSTVLIKIAGVNYTMTFVSFDLYRYSWTPVSMGSNAITIYANDTLNNWGQLSDSVLVVDTTKPNLSNIGETADPLELGQTETITVSVTDLVGISQVLINLGGSNISMTNIGGYVWQYAAWNPSNTGVNNYTIYAVDTSGNVNSTISGITVVDTTKPSFINLVESADPLELGSNETITIDAIDLNGITGVVIEIGGVNYTMTNIGGNSWRYNTWNPSSIGSKFYIIYATDNAGNIQSLAGSILVQDATLPSLSSLIESANPLELGNTETISITATDISGISTVVIEIGGVNYTMNNLGGNVWQYSTWNPNSIGVKNYQIYATDNNGLINSVSSSISVMDTTSPSLSNLIKSADPLELGNTETINIDVSDIGGINQVLIEIVGTNYTMSYISGNTYRYNNWIPSNIGSNSFKIYAIDNLNNINSITNSILVQDTVSPILINLSESADPLELGNSEILTIDVTDIAGIFEVLLQFEGANHTMTNIGGNTWRHSTWTPGSIGVYPYIVFAKDNSNIGNSISGSITVSQTIYPQFAGLTKSADPLEWGNTETISIIFTDPTEIRTVLIQLSNINYTMSNISSVWQYSWTPATVGSIAFTIYANNSLGLWNATAGTINVQDTSGPIISEVNHGSAILELGNNVTIKVKAYDLAGIIAVKISLDGEIFAMQLNNGYWIYSDWSPNTIGVHSIQIIATDGNANNKTYYDSVEVVDTLPPIIESLQISQLNVRTGQTFDITVRVRDNSGIENLTLTIDGQIYEMTENEANIWEIKGISFGKVGDYRIILSVIDVNGNENTAIDTVHVIDNSIASTIQKDLTDDPIPISVALIVSIIGVSLIVFTHPKKKVKWDLK